MDAITAAVDEAFARWLDEHTEEIVKAIARHATMPTERTTTP
jgi:hypothetical protein